MKSENFNKNENLKISNVKYSKINLDKKIKNFKIISNLKISREKSRYIKDLFDVYIKFTVTYHPESNGLTENRNRKIEKSKNY